MFPSWTDTETFSIANIYYYQNPTLQHASLYNAVAMLLTFIFNTFLDAGKAQRTRIKLTGKRMQNLSTDHLACTKEMQS